MDIAAVGESMAQTTRTTRLRAVARDVAAAAGRGEPMSTVLNRHADAFPPIALGMIKAGEQSGRIEQAAADLAAYFEAQHGFHVALWAAIFYPLLLIGAGVVLGPIPSSIGVGIGHYLKTAATYASPFVLLFGLVALLMVLQARNWALAESVDRVYVSIPWLGGVERRRSLGRWAQAYAMLWDAGLSQAECLELSAPAAGNRAVAYALWRTVPGAREGIPLSQLLASSREVSPELAHVVATGEQSGTVGDCLRRLGETYSSESEAGRKKIIFVAYVAVYLLAAAFVGYLIIRAWASHYQGVWELLESTGVLTPADWG
jgi:type II secretory pathway component PulF